MSSVSSVLERQRTVRACGADSSGSSSADRPTRAPGSPRFGAGRPPYCLGGCWSARPRQSSSLMLRARQAAAGPGWVRPVWDSCLLPGTAPAFGSPFLDGHHPAVHEHVRHPGLLLEEIAARHDDIGHLARLERAKPIGDARDLRGIDRQGPQGGVTRQAVLDRARDVSHELVRLAQPVGRERGVRDIKGKGTKGKGRMRRDEG